MAPLTDKKILVTGATGFLGGAIVRRLSAEGAHVRALARRPNRDRYLQGLENVEIVSGDITDTPRMREVIDGCDFVFHAAAALAGKLAEQRRINVDGTRVVMRAAAEAGVQRAVHVSSISVYGYHAPAHVPEDTPQRPGRSAYNLSKSEAEKVVREIGAKTGLSYSIIRPGMIYGPHSSMWTVTMFKLAKRNPTWFFGKGDGSAYPIFVDDVVDLTLLLAHHPAAEGEAFNCAPDPSPSWREFLGGYAALVGHDRWFGMPLPLVKGLAVIADLFLTLTGQPQDASDALSLLTRPVTYKMDKARDVLGWQPKMSLQEGIQACAPYLREKGLLD